MNRKITFPLVFVIVLVTSVLGESSAQAEQPANGSGINGSRIKNVLFIISDDLKASVLGCYGDKICKTPNIDALARRGMVFDRAYCNATWCAPSRQSMMFSRYPGTGPIGSTGVGSGPAGAAHVNMGQHFRQSGFYSARVGKIYHMRVPGDIVAGTNGIDVPSSWTERFNSAGQEAHTPGDYACLNQNIFTTDLANRESTKMKHRMFVTVKSDGDGSDQPDHKSATKAIQLLKEHLDGPFFLAVGLVRPHYPMVAPRQFFKPYPWDQIQMPRSMRDDLKDIPNLGMGQTLSDKSSIGRYPDNQKRMWAGYYASVSFMDQQVGRILDELDQLGLRETTAVVFTSDHGYHLGEHQFWEKSNLHEEVARVPLIISAPGFKARRSDSFAELVDVFPTLAELSGLKVPETVQGRSLVPVMRDSNATVRDAALSNQRGRLLRTSGWAYMRYDDKTEELYNMNSDPHQFTNLAFEPAAGEHTGRLNEMRAALDMRLKQIGAEEKRNKPPK